MKPIVFNNHLKQQYILLGTKKDLDDASIILQKQGETAKYLCCTNQTGKEYITVTQCIKLCSEHFLHVWDVSNSSKEIIGELENHNISVTTWDSLFQNVPKRACHYEEMYIDRYGNVHCCCKTYLNNIIGNLGDYDISQKILNYIPKHSCVCSKGQLSSADETGRFITPKLASIELSSLCNAQCTYCFQNDEHKGSEYKYYKELLTVIQDLKLSKLIFAGGEIPCQPQSIDFIKKIRNQNPDIWIHLKSNGCHGLDKVAPTERLFNSITITLNGFSESTVSLIMKVSFEKIKCFCEALATRGRISIGLKFLASPANICELPEFLKWSTALPIDRVIVPSARIYACDQSNPAEWLGSTFNGLNMAYWDPIFKRISSQIKEIFIHAKEKEAKVHRLVNENEFLKNIYINETVLQMDTELQHLLNITEAVEDYNYGKHVERII